MTVFIHSLILEKFSCFLYLISHRLIMQQLLLDLVHLFIQPLHVSASFIRPSSGGYLVKFDKIQ
jgi:hypothetical protein